MDILDSHVAKDDPYAHQPLDTATRQVRLLKIARSSSGPIEGTLEIFDLDAAPKYTAVSYRWGSPIADHGVTVDGRTLRVSANLFYFLKTHRREDVDEYLWIDQICIAQSNKAERNHQVGMMSLIYSRCDCTIVWLNDDKDHYPVIAEDFNRTHSRKALLGLLDDSYFERLWIVQEVILSSNIWVFVSGNVWVQWSTIRECFLTKAWGPEHAILRALFRPETLFQRKNLNFQRLTLGACILTFSDQLCEDPRDKVYGLLGIVMERKNLVVDYNKTAEQVYIDALVAIGTFERDECAERLGDVFKIPGQRRTQLLALLDLLQPVHVRGQVSVLEDCSPSTPLGSGLVSSIGLAFAAEPASAMEGPGVLLDALDNTWVDELNGTDGQIFLHEPPVVGVDKKQDDGSPFDAGQAIIAFHHHLHEVDWGTGNFADFCGKGWQTQEAVAKTTFWTYVAIRKDEQGQLRSQPRPQSCRSRWCYGYQGHVYEYARQPQWEILFGIRPVMNLMPYVLQACSKVQTCVYRQPIEAATGREIHWVQRRQQVLDADSQGGSKDCSALFASRESWRSCDSERACNLYGGGVTILRDHRRDVLARHPELIEAPWSRESRLIGGRSSAGSDSDDSDVVYDKLDEVSSEPNEMISAEEK